MKIKKRKLSDRAVAILSVIIEKTTDDGGFWMPNGGGRGCDDWSSEFHIHLNISGSGDANILRKLQRDGLIERPKTCLNSHYIFRATEEGIIAFEECRDRFDSILLDMRRDWEMMHGIRPESEPTPPICDDTAFFRGQNQS